MQTVSQRAGARFRNSAPVFVYKKKKDSLVNSGFFQRIYRNPTFLCPYRVIKIEQVRDPENPYHRYLVTKSPGVPGKMWTPESGMSFF
jgi:hypothetical protein